MKISSIFVAFLENTNFIDHLSTYYLYHLPTPYWHLWWNSFIVIGENLHTFNISSNWYINCIIFFRHRHFPGESPIKQEGQEANVHTNDVNFTNEETSNDYGTFEQANVQINQTED